MTTLLAPTRLRCEGLADPLGLDEVLPRLSWLPSPGGVPQAGVQIRCASSREGLLGGEADRWQYTGSGASLVSVRYAGTPLWSRDQVWWQVRIHDALQRWTPWSDVASFEMGLLAHDSWAPAVPVRTALRGTSTEPGQVPMLRREVHLTDPGEARLYVTALGSYDVRINGEPVSDDVLRPGWTEYHRRLAYQVYDVTALLRTGTNVVSALLGDGWYCGFIGGGRQQYGDRPALLLRLEVADRTAQQPVTVLGTDEGWRWAPSAIRASDHYLGERYDAGDEPVGWRSAGFDDGSWLPVEVYGGHLPVLVSPRSPGVRAVQEIAPELVATDGSGLSYTYDLQENVAGRLQLALAGTAGTVVRIRHAEALQEDGDLWRDNLGAASAEEEVVLGSEELCYEPVFTYHGFRYARLDVLEGALTAPPVVIGKVLTTPLDDTGDFSCSSPLLTAFMAAVWRSQRANFLEIPTDCPQRDERLGWTGDIHPFAPTATFRADVRPILEKWLRDLADCQIDAGPERGQYSSVAPYRWMAGGPAWSDAAILVPSVLHERYGDLTAIEEHYGELVTWMAFLARRHAGRVPETWAGYGDWLSLDAGPDRTWGWDDRFGGTSPAFLQLAFHIRAADLMERAARSLERPEDAGRWRDLAVGLRAEFAERFVVDGVVRPLTQTSASLALDLRLLPPGAVEPTAAALAADVKHHGHVRSGFVGTPHLLSSLRDHGYVDLAYGLLEREDPPSWLFPIAHGATTVWERWDAWSPETGFNKAPMNSLNHYALGSVGDWVVQTVGGIRPCAEHPGYEHVVLHPQPGGTISHAETRLVTVRGEVSCSWRLEGDRLEVAVRVPPASWATVRLDTSRPETVEGPGTDAMQARRGGLDITIGPGSHEWTVLA